MYRYFFSPDFSRDQIVLAKASGQDGKPWALYRSTDGGRTWSLNLEENISDLSFSPNYAQDQTIFAVPFAGVISAPYFLRSADRGVTWQRLLTPADGPWVGGFSSIAVEHAKAIFYGRSAAPIWDDELAHGLFHFTFTDAGVTWEQLAKVDINEVSLSPRFSEDHTLFIGAFGYKVNYGLFKSTDGGRSWTPSSNGIDLSVGGAGSAYTESIVFAPDFPADSVIFSEANWRYYRSTDAGASWQRVDPYPPPTKPTPTSAARWVLSPYFGRDRMAWIGYGRLLTTDAGDTWTEVGTTEVQDLAARAACAPDGQCGVLLLGGGTSYDDRAGVYESYDLGRTWHCAAEENIPPAEIPEPATWLLLGSGVVGLAGYARSRHRQRV